MPSARVDRRALWLVVAALVLELVRDSLDGTLARVRRAERPRYGFYVDHVSTSSASRCSSRAGLLGCSARGGVSPVWRWRAGRLLLVSGEVSFATAVRQRLSDLLRAWSDGAAHRARHRHLGARWRFHASIFGWLRTSAAVRRRAIRRHCIVSPVLAVCMVTKRARWRAQSRAFRRGMETAGLEAWSEYDSDPGL